MGGLFERAAEVSAIEEALRDAAAGTGRSVVLAGPAGIGKSTLVSRAQEHARAAGFTVLSSCATPVSTALPHGVIRDWLGTHVRSGKAGSPPFDGPATDLADALANPSSRHQVWNLASLDYALTWVLESLSESQPLLLVVDEVQWVDVASLQVLDLLSARVRLMPVVLLLALRTGEPTDSPDIVNRIGARAMRLDLAPLSVVGVEQLRRRLGCPPALAGVSAQELHRLTGGVPFLLRELLRSGTPDRIPNGVVDSVRERLTRLGPEAVTVARATAVLGEDAEFDALAELTSSSVADLADPLELLTDAGLVGLGMWRAWPAHPLVAEAVLFSMTPSERSELHRAAADYLTKQGRSRQVVASHLVHTLPQEDPAVVEVLRTAGEESLRAGAPDAAARQLLRAVGETRPEDTDPDLLALAASAHLHAGRRAEAFDLWARALDHVEDPEAQARLLSDIGDVQATMGQRSEASQSYYRAVTVLTEAGHDSSSPAMRHVLVRMGLTRALYDGARPEIVNAVTDAMNQGVERDTHTDRMLFALAASDLALRGESRAVARDLALRSLGDGALLEEETPEGIGFYVASGVLSWADAYEENLAALGAAVEEARRRGSVLGFAAASYCRGLVHYRQGRLRQASAEFQAALDLRARGWTDFAETGLAGAALTLVGLGQHEEALALEPQLRAAAARGQFVAAFPLAAAGVVRASHGDHEQALDDYRNAARLMGGHPDNASIVEWRELSAWSLLALGRNEAALELADEALTHARRWGAPRALGFALRTKAQLTPRDESIELLREAVAHFESVDSVDYRTRAWIDLARLLVPGSPAERDEGVVLLRQTVEYGRAADIPPAVIRATRLLMRAGEPVSDPAANPASSLTPGERRVVDLAIAGDTNRQIAQKLFVTVKAVEWHLSHAYRKLKISSRAELAAALYDEPGWSSSSER
jgi:DNA-binding NarL/FixJ family response regulator